MKTMVSSYGAKVNVIQHIILSNGWEYYVTTDKHDEDIVRCVVMGFETELGDVYLPELERYIVSRRPVYKNTELLPAKGWKWENSEF
jgi:hypothetical protein